MERFSYMSADVCSDLTIGLASKNYPKMTPHMLKSVHWFQSLVRKVLLCIVRQLNF